eukprot:TRINITY_DN7518_c0_g2_i1.p1 TRINITY_DN7518_c0_g2~~TRINITY_DN7518_c0_g2_i1.p1  ORF type:complete len:252 (-),score=38.09 TRINITY_DN7518_c0_g2_i1:80-835(-)
MIMIRVIVSGVFLGIGYLAYQFPYVRYLLGVGFVWLGWKIYNIYLYNTTEMIKRPSINSGSTYQDPELLDRAWKSPVASLLAKEGGIVYQPSEGYCGVATVNNILATLNEKQIPHHRSPYTLSQLKVKLESCDIDHKIEAIDLFTGENKEELAKLFRTQLNDTRYRFLANFLRGPLFYSDSRNIFKRFFSGHWSPVLSYLPDKDLIMVGDCNKKYNAWLVPVDRFVDAIHTRDYFQSGNAWRGVLRVTVKQ